MEKTFISPSKYVQGSNVIEKIGSYVKPLGTVALVMADDFVWELLGDKVVGSLEKEGIKVEKVHFQGESSENEVIRIIDNAKDKNIGVCIGIGGGKAIDTVKAVGYGLHSKWVTVPTVAASDAPTSALSVIYSDEGVFESYKFYPQNPDLVLVDTKVIAEAPTRFFAAGIGDALATWVEGRATIEARKKAMAGGGATLAATAIAEKCWDTLFAYGYSAVQAVEKNAVTPAVEAVVEANTLLSGLGFESAGLAAAHAIHNGFTVLHGEIHSLMHGEKVAFGTLTQLILESRDMDEIDRFIELCVKIGLPTTLAEIKLENASMEELYKVAEAACKPDETMNNMSFEVTPQMVVDAMLTADQYAKKVREKMNK